MSDYTRPVPVASIADYRDSSVVSTAFGKSNTGNLIAFAFDAGQELKEHTATKDAWILVTEGELEFRVLDQDFTVPSGQIFRIPAKAEHSVKAVNRAKMLLAFIG